MIIKGASRARPKNLAQHLGRVDTNERVEVLELHSPTGSTLEAFRDWQALAAGTKGSKGLYHANIDPDARYTMTPEQWTRAVDVLEEELGLQGQPRAVVLHEKEGREHIHVVWQRTDIETMTMRSDSYNYHAHERASLRLEREFEHEFVPGKHAKRDREVQPEIPSSEVNHAESQQAQRTKVDPLVRREQVRALFEASDSGMAFKAALEDAGYVVARGDQRNFVLIDGQGEVHSLGRQLKGLPAKELRAFMADVPIAELPSASDARLIAQDRIREPEQSAAADRPPSDSELWRAALEERHRAAFADMDQRHAREVAALQESQQQRASEAFDQFAREQARPEIAERPPEPGTFERMWRSIREAVSEEARLQRANEEGRRLADVDARRETEIRIMVAGIEAAHRNEINELVMRQGRERADLSRDQRSDMKRRLRDEEQAQELRREYERREREALARDREGPERDDRAR